MITTSRFGLVQECLQSLNHRPISSPAPFYPMSSERMRSNLSELQTLGMPEFVLFVGRLFRRLDTLHATNY